MESTIYKFYDSAHHSGIFYGPISIVYGFGALLIIIIDKYLIQRWNQKKIIKGIISFFLFAILLSFIEWIGGTLIEILFEISLWDYSDYKFHIGKYISVEMAIIWGAFSLIFLYILKPFFDKFMKRFPKFISYLAILLFIIDIIATILTGSYNNT